MNTITKIKFSIIIAVYERPFELKEILQSLANQKCKNFEVIVVDDGSTNKLNEITESFSDSLEIYYYYKHNSGPGLSRNLGASKANAEYLIFLDSDTIIPYEYICEVQEELNRNYVDFFGGSDNVHHSFSALQKAINFSMTSFMTTGGIRGGKQAAKKFQPRSFNMGISKDAFEKVGGFSHMRIGEDPDLTMRLWENSFKSRWFSKSYVYHKRRTSLNKFSKQVLNFGIARPILNQKHPNYRSFTFWFPSLFLIGILVSILFSIYGVHIFTAFYIVYFLLVLVFSSIENKSVYVGFLSIVTTFIQFTNYGYGFILSQIQLNILKKPANQAFPNHFYNI